MTLWCRSIWMRTADEFFTVAKCLLNFCFENDRWQSHHFNYCHLKPFCRLSFCFSFDFNFSFIPQFFSGVLTFVRNGGDSAAYFYEFIWDSMANDTLHMLLNRICLPHLNDKVLFVKTDKWKISNHPEWTETELEQSAT